MIDPNASLAHHQWLQEPEAPDLDRDEIEAEDADRWHDQRVDREAEIE